jgi:hypothetical protein
MSTFGKNIPNLSNFDTFMYGKHSICKLNDKAFIENNCLPMYMWLLLLEHIQYILGHAGASEHTYMLLPSLLSIRLNKLNRNSENVGHQGDQIGLILANREIDYFGSNFENLRSSANFWATFLYGIILTKGVGLHTGRLLPKLFWSPCWTPQI